jgi:hypothetical protein
MDQSVLDAVQRWPNVPAVYGWLSLSARGDWRLHPLGDAQSGGPGEGISNPQILGFMGRNYASEPHGEWFFQNGPQRVYVRLDAAPYIVHVEPNTSALKTHNGRVVEHVFGWFVDEYGQLYAQTDLGAARIDDRDLGLLAEILQTPEGLSLLDILDTLYTLNAEPSDTSTALCDPTACLLSDPFGHYSALRKSVVIVHLLHARLAETLGFVKNPQGAVISL